VHRSRASTHSAINFLTTGRYPQQELNRGWEFILLNQFHDIIAGSSIAEVYRDSEREFEQVTALGKQCLDEALTQLSSRVCSPGSERLLFIFNPLCWKRSEPILVPLEEIPNNFAIVDHHGNPIPFQIVGNNAVLVQPHEVPAMGFKTYQICEGESANSFATSLNISTHHLQNRFFYIELDAQGLITSIYDKKSDREIIQNGRSGNVLQLFEDRPLANDAWDIDIFYQQKCCELRELEESKE